MTRGTKRKIPLAKIENDNSRHVAFSKRRKGLYSKASDLCLLSGGKIAIIATPVSSKSNVSFYSFGHNSVDSVVSAFLANQYPREDDNDDDDLGFWWNDDALYKSENPDELREAMNSMTQMLQHLKDLEKRGDHDEDVEKKGVLHAQTQDFIVTHQSQTLDFQSSSTSANFDKNIDDQILAISDNNNSGLTANNEAWFDQELNLDDMSDFEAFVYGGSTKDEDDLHAKRRDLQLPSTSENFQGFNKKSEEQILAISDNNNKNSGGLTVNLDGIGANQEEPENYEDSFDGLDLDIDLILKILDENKCNSQRDVDENNLQLSDVFNELPSITAL